MNKASNSNGEYIFRLIGQYVDYCLEAKNTIRFGMTIIFSTIIAFGIILLLINNIFNVNLRSLVWLLIKFYGLFLISAGILLIYVFWHREKSIRIKTINAITLATALSGFKGVLSPRGVIGRNIPTLMKIIRMISLSLMLVSFLNLMIIAVLYVLSSEIIMDSIVSFNPLHMALGIMLVAPMITYVLIIKTVDIILVKLSKLLENFKVRIKFEKVSGNRKNDNEKSNVINFDEYVYRVMQNLFSISYIPYKGNDKQETINKVKETYIRVFSQAMIMRITTIAPYIASIEEFRKDRNERVIDTIVFIFSLSEILKIHLDLNEIYSKVTKKQAGDEEIRHRYLEFTNKLLDQVQEELSGTEHMIISEANTLRLLGTKNQLKIELLVKSR